MNNKTSHSIIPILPIILLLGTSIVAVSSLMILLQQLSPSAGNTMMIHGIIVSAFFCFLASGFWRGGQLIKNISFYLKRNFLLLAFILGLGLSPLFLTLFFQGMSHFISDYFLVSLSLYLLIIMAPSGFLLGENIAINIHFFDEQQHHHITHSYVLFWCAMGCFIGVVAALIGITVLGIAWTVVLLVSLLVILSVSLIQDYLHDIVTLSVLASGLLISIAANVEAQMVLSPGQSTAFAKNQHRYFIYAPNVWHSEVIVAGHENQQNIAVSQLIRKILFQDLAVHKKNILVLGDPQFNLSMPATENNTFTYVNNTKDKLSACNYLNLLVSGNFKIETARQFVQQAKHKYSVIIADMDSQNDSHLLSYEHIMNIRQALPTNGIALFNVTARPTLTDIYSKRVDNTIRAVFPNCMEIPLSYSQKPTNIIYVCKKSVQEQDTAVYTDNKKTAAFAGFDWWQRKGLA